MTTVDTGLEAGSPVLTREIEGVLVVTINRPQVRNAINTAAAQGIAAAMDELDARTDLVAGVLTGAGTAFCTGMDLKRFSPGSGPRCRPRFRRHRGATAGQAAGGRRRGLRRRGRIRDRAGMRRHRRRPGRHVRPARGEAWPGRRRWRSAALAGSGATRPGGRVGAHRGFVPATRAVEVGLVNRLTEPGAALDGALEVAGDRRQRPARGPGDQAHPGRVARVAGRRGIRPAARDQRARPGVCGRAEGARAFAEKRRPQRRLTPTQ